MKLTSTIIILFTSVLTYAQEQQIIIVDKSYKSPRASSKERKSFEVDNTWAVKFCPTQMFAGEINFGVELKVQERMSLEFEIGPTVSNIGRNNFHFFPNNTEANENSAIGFLFSTALRYYPMEDHKVFNKFYISPKFRFRNYNTVYSYDYISFNKLEDQRGTNNQFGFIFNLGVQDWLSPTFAVDYFIGFGLGYQNNNYYRVDQTYDQNTGQTINVWRSENENFTNYIVQLGIKLGIGN